MSTEVRRGSLDSTSLQAPFAQREFLQSPRPDLVVLQQRAVNTLQTLVTPDGIFASSPRGNEGMYYGFFARDAAITNKLIIAAEENGERQFSDTATYALKELMQWQGKKDDPDTGEEVGKITHEVRTEGEHYRHLTQGLETNGERSWYVDPNDNYLKNWDSLDATPLWIIEMSQAVMDGRIDLDPRLQTALQSGLQWCMRKLDQDIDDIGNLAGFSYNPNRRYNGLRNHGWKDSEQAYLLPDGSLPNHPINDVYVNALFWSALKHGAAIDLGDRLLQENLTEKAEALKRRFNDPDGGFLIFDGDSDFYFAEAIDGEGRKLEHVSADPALALSAYFGDESVIEDRYIPRVIERVMMDDIFNPEAGIKNYSHAGVAFDPDGYHRGAYTYWPFVSALAANGMDHFGATDEARQVLTAMLQGVSNFDSCLELFMKPNGTYEKYRNSKTGQTSATDQAWTGAAMYYATRYLQRQGI